MYKKKKRKIFLRKLIIFLMVSALVISLTMVSLLFINLFHPEKFDEGFVPQVFGKNVSKRVEKAKELSLPDYVTQDLIHHHTTARTGFDLVDIKNIVIHYVGNPMTTAKNNRDYFDKPDTTVSSHFVIGLDGEIIQCLPLWERSAASNHRNKDTISIEVCHEDEEGEFNEKTYKSLIKLTAFLCNYFSIDSRDVIRHYDITNKICPKYYVENEDAWDKLKSDVKKALDEY